MKIMGIDPGLAQVGWGVIEVFDQKKPVLVDNGCVSTSKNQSIVVRLNIIYEELRTLVEKHKPDEVSVEEIFFASNAKTAINVAQARGVIMVALMHSKIMLYEYTPLQIKQALVGYGRADKNQVKFMVKNFLNLKDMPKTDHAADALAAAICHNSSRKVERLIKGKQV